MSKTVEIDLEKLVKTIVGALVAVEFLVQDMTPEDIEEMEGQILESLIPEGIEDRFTNMLARELSMELVTGLYEKGRG